MAVAAGSRWWQLLQAAAALRLLLQAVDGGSGRFTAAAAMWLLQLRLTGLGVCVNAVGSVHSSLSLGSFLSGALSIVIT